LRPERPTFPVDRHPVVLPVDLGAFQAGELRHAHPGVEERPDDEPLDVGLAGVREPVRFVRGRRLALVLIAPHAPSSAEKRPLWPFLSLRLAMNPGDVCPSGDQLADFWTDWDSARTARRACLPPQQELHLEAELPARGLVRPDRVIEVNYQGLRVS